MLRHSTSRRMSMFGARHIPGNAICTTMSRTEDTVSRELAVRSAFAAVGSTVRQQAAISAWTGATIVNIEPAPGIDGVGMIGYKVTNPSAGVWHYEYAIYNQNLDRAIQSFRVPSGAGVTLSNVGFHAPPQHPGWTFDGTVGNTGYSSTPWAQTQAGWYDDLEFGNLCTESKRERYPLGHAV